MRQPFITPEIESELQRYMASIFQACQSPALLIGGTDDHVHSLFALSRTTNVADVVKEIKASSSKWMKRHEPDFQWQIGYGAFSIGQSQVPSVKKYIANQKEHHQAKAYQDEFRGLCRKYEVDFDERYVWD